MKLTLKKTFAWGFAILALWAPTVVLAEASLTVPCGQVKDDCTFPQLIRYIENITDYLIFNVGVWCAALAFLYLGFRVITSQGKVNARKEAIELGWTIVQGFALIVGAYAIVQFIFSFIDPQYHLFIQ